MRGPSGFMGIPFKTAEQYLQGNASHQAIQEGSDALDIKSRIEKALSSHDRSEDLRAIAEPEARLNTETRDLLGSDEEPSTSKGRRSFGQILWRFIRGQENKPSGIGFITNQGKNGENMLALYEYLKQVKNSLNEEEEKIYEEIYREYMDEFGKLRKEAEEAFIKALKYTLLRNALFSAALGIWGANLFTWIKDTSIYEAITADSRYPKISIELPVGFKSEELPDGSIRIFSEINNADGIILNRDNNGLLESSSVSNLQNFFQNRNIEMKPDLPQVSSSGAPVGNTSPTQLPGVDSSLVTNQNVAPSQIPGSEVYDGYRAGNGVLWNLDIRELRIDDEIVEGARISRLPPGKEIELDVRGEALKMLVDGQYPGGYRFEAVEGGEPMLWYSTKNPEGENIINYYNLNNLPDGIKVVQNPDGSITISVKSDLLHGATRVGIGAEGPKGVATIASIPIDDNSVPGTTIPDFQVPIEPESGSKSAYYGADYRTIAQGENVIPEPQVTPEDTSKVDYDVQGPLVTPVSSIPNQDVSREDRENGGNRGNDRGLTNVTYTPLTTIEPETDTNKQGVSYSPDDAYTDGAETYDLVKIGPNTDPSALQITENKQDENERRVMKIESLIRSLGGDIQEIYKHVESIRRDPHENPSLVELSDILNKLKSRISDGTSRKKFKGEFMYYIQHLFSNMPSGQQNNVKDDGNMTDTTQQTGTGQGVNTYKVSQNTQGSSQRLGKDKQANKLSPDLESLESIERQLAQLLQELGLSQEDASLVMQVMGIIISDGALPEVEVKRFGSIVEKIKKSLLQEVLKRNPTNQKYYKEMLDKLFALFEIKVKNYGKSVEGNNTEGNNTQYRSDPADKRELSRMEINQAVLEQNLGLDGKK